MAVIGASGLVGSAFLLAPSSRVSAPALRGAPASQAQGAAGSNSSLLVLGTVTLVSTQLAFGRRKTLRRAEPAAEPEVAKPPAPPKPEPGPIAIPFLGEPQYRRFISNCPGDAGFDPANFAGESPQVFVSRQEAEIKHCRLAMLAALGWVTAELDEQGLAKTLGWPDLLAKNEMAPSVLNGGLINSKYPAEFLVLFLIAAAVIDLSKEVDTMPGDYGFDPLNLINVTPPVIGGFNLKGRVWMREAELKNGRLAMIAITAYAAQEFVTKVPVVDETPLLFGR